MSIVRYNSNNFLPVSFRHLVNTFFNEPVGLNASTQSTVSFLPNADIAECDEAFHIHVEAPGMKKEDFKVEINDSYLTISGDRQMKFDEKKENLHVVETRYGHFSRSFALPDQVEVGKIKAQYNDGILEVTLPKDKKKDAKQLEIRVS